MSATATIVVTGLVASDVVSGTTLLNLARVDSANPDNVPGNNQSTASTDVTAEALMTLTKVASPSSATPGATVTYRIVVANDGPSTARAVVVADTLPAEIVNPLISSSQGGCTIFPCALGDIEPGGTATILVVGTVASSVTADFDNTASVTSDTAFAEGSETSDTATVAVTAQADLDLALASTPTTIAGTTAIVTATVSNVGPSVANGAVVTITLPAGTSYSSENLPSGLDRGIERRAARWC